MELAIFVAFAVVLAGLSAALVWWHLASWRALRETDLDPEEFDYRRRQFRRRMQTSLMLGAVGVAILIGSRISPQAHPSLFVFYWWGVGLLVIWVALLAVADMISTRQYIGRLRSRYQRELDAARRELLKREGNGAPREGP